MRIQEIQGAGHVSPLVGRKVTGVRGIVTATTNKGFFLQDPQPDPANPASCALYVFLGRQPALHPGDEVEVAGRVDEWRVVREGQERERQLSGTQINGQDVRTLATGRPLPPPVVIGAGGRTPPAGVMMDGFRGDVEAPRLFDPARNSMDFWESLEFMRVQIPDAVVVGPRKRYGEFAVLRAGGATQSQRTARGALLQCDMAELPEILLVSNRLAETPPVNVGDRLGTVEGVVDYSDGRWRIQLTGPLTITPGKLTRARTRPAAPEELVIATFNVENLSPADGPGRFARLAEEIVAHLMAPDVLALQEIQDGNGPVNDGLVDASQTYGRLIDAIRAIGGPTYQFRDIPPLDDADAGQPGGNIRTGFLFRTDRGLTFMDRIGGDATLDVTVLPRGDGGLKLSASPGRIGNVGAAFHSCRKPLLGEFQWGGQTLFVLANHFYGKNRDDSLFGRYQPPARVSEERRHLQARAVHAFVADLLQLDPDARVVVVGDLNDYAYSETLRMLQGEVLYPAMAELPADERYTYNEKGCAQALDHILLSRSLWQGRWSYEIVHMNAEFTDRPSDHDPSLVRLVLPG